MDAWVGLRDKLRIAVKSSVSQVLELNLVVRVKLIIHSLVLSYLDT